jgi:predicted dehydrogenase
VVKDTLGFGLIGLGEIAYKSTGKLLQQTQNARMVAGVDPVPEMAESYQETYGIPCSTDLKDVLEHPDVDAVVISTPHKSHVALGIEAARAGKHVVVEKPMATTLEDADALIEACRDAGVLCSPKEGGVHYQPTTVKARELIAQGAIGDVMAVYILGAANKPDSYWTGGYTNRVQTTWRKFKEEAGGGILIMNYIYDIYRIRNVTGLEVVRVFAEYDTYRTPVEVEDFITVSFRFSNGALGNLTASSCAPGASKAGMRGTHTKGNRIFGTEGQIVFADDELLVYTERDIPGLERGDWTQLSLPPEEPYVTYFDRFAEAVLKGERAPIPAEEGRRDLEVILAAYESGRLNAPIYLNGTGV